MGGKETNLEGDYTRQVLPLISDQHDITEEGHSLLDAIFNGHGSNILGTRGNDDL